MGDYEDGGEEEDEWNIDKMPFDACNRDLALL
jgi:hypothetical protein